MNQDYKTEAERIIEEFCKIIYPGERYVNITPPKQCAILHVQGIIDELEEWGAPYLYEDSQSNDNAKKRMDFLTQVLHHIQTKI